MSRIPQVREEDLLDLEDTPPNLEENSEPFHRPPPPPPPATEEDLEEIPGSFTIPKSSLASAAGGGGEGLRGLGGLGEVGSVGKGTIRITDNMNENLRIYFEIMFQVFSKRSANGIQPDGKVSELMNTLNMQRIGRDYKYDTLRYFFHLTYKDGLNEYGAQLKSILGEEDAKKFHGLGRKLQEQVSGIAKQNFTRGGRRRKRGRKFTFKRNRKTTRRRKGKRSRR